MAQPMGPEKQRPALGKEEQIRQKREQVLAEANNARKGLDQPIVEVSHSGPTTNAELVKKYAAQLKRFGKYLSNKLKTMPGKSAAIGRSIAKIEGGFVVLTLIHRYIEHTGKEKEVRMKLKFNADTGAYSGLEHFEMRKSGTMVRLLSGNIISEFIEEITDDWPKLKRMLDKQFESQKRRASNADLPQEKEQSGWILGK